MIWLRKNSFSSNNSEKWAEVERQGSGSEGISDSYYGSKKEWTEGKIDDLSDIFLSSSLCEAVKSNAAA